MGLQGAEKAIGILVIEQASESDQLLISLCRKGVQWLSPVGWTDQQKVTLLDCRSADGKTEIFIPAEFSKDIQTGDTLLLRCSELDLEKEIVWTETHAQAQPVQTSASETATTGGLFSRFKSAKVEPVEEEKSEAERRAEDAGRAAENFKAKMEAAAAAKEEAQRTALEAARQAEAALKMEADRIAEMERAAKAFEEAERLKQDEMRRVEEERHAEEERLAEEARRIEAARKREAEAKLAAERKAALERYETALDVTHNEEARLKERLGRLKTDAVQLKERDMGQAAQLSSIREKMTKAETSLNARQSTYDKNNAKLEKANADFLNAQEQTTIWEADKETISQRLAQAEAEYEQARKEAEAAIAQADQKRLEHEAIRQEKGEVRKRLENLASDMEIKSRAFSEITVKTQKSQSKFEEAQAELNQKVLDIATIERDQLSTAEATQNLRLEIEATQQAIEDTQDREAHHRKAIVHLESGGDPAAVADIVSESRPYKTAENSGHLGLGANFTYAGADDAGFADRILGRVRSTFSRAKDPEISIAIDDEIFDDLDPVSLDPAIIAGAETQPGFMRRHSTSLMAIGAVIGGMAILGGGYAINQSASKPNLQVKSSQPAPTQVASVATKIEPPKSDITADETDVSSPLISEAETLPIEAEQLVVPIMPELPREDATEAVESAIEKVASIAELPKDNAAFELPDMMPKNGVAVIKEKLAVKEKKLPTESVKKSVPKPEAQKPKTQKKAELTKPVSEKEASIATPITAKINKVEDDAPTYYPEFTKDIQTRLAGLGLYLGQVDGEMTPETSEAIETFTALFSTGEQKQTQAGLLSELRRVEHEQKKAQSFQSQSSANTIEDDTIQIAAIEPDSTVYDILPAVPSTPVDVEILEAASTSPTVYETVNEPVISAPIEDINILRDTVTSQPSIVKEASAPTAIEAAPVPAVADVIVPAKLLKNAGASYPRRAESRGYYVDVAITVSYDIDVDGKATNMSIASNDHSGRYNSEFEKEALKAVKKLKFSPKTVNGEAVITTGKMKRIVFRGS